MCLMIARFLLSRIESLSAAPTSLSFLRFHSKSSKSSAGGQGWPLRAQWRDSVICSVPHPLLSTNPTDSPELASAFGCWWFLVTACACGGLTHISRLNLCPSATCRALRACPLWHLPSVSASAVADAKTAVKHHRPTHFRPLEPHLKCTLISRPTAVPAAYIFVAK